MKFNVLGFKQQELIDNDLDIADALLLRTIKDMYSSASMEFVNEDGIKYMWINYSYLQREIPIIGSKRSIMRKIQRYGEELYLLRLLRYERKGQKGKFSYISPTRKLDMLQDLDLMTESHKGYAKNDTTLMSKSHIKDPSTTKDPSTNDLKNIQKEEFEKFWNMYDYKKDRKKCESKWKKLKPEDKEKIFETLHLYVKSTPDKQYRKNPATYLNNESWNDEINITNSNNIESSNYQPELQRFN